jgi:plastocyanin
MKHYLLATGLLLAVSGGSVFAGGDTELLIVIKDYKFIPPEITIRQGQTLRWENREKRQYHSVWFEALGEPEPEDYLFPDDTYERSFDKSGTFPYRCGPHPEMTGTVTVIE